MLLVAIGFFAVILCLVFVPAAKGNENLLNVLILALSNVFTALAVHRPPEKPTDPKP
jgi:hypothetical protein